MITIALYLILGAFAGTMAGLFGIGGGLIIVPVLLWSFTYQGMPSELIFHMAIATSLATIVLTTISSALSHHLQQTVRWKLLPAIVLGVGLGAIIGASSMVNMPGQWLKTGFAIFVVLVGIKLLLGIKPCQGESNGTRPFWLASGTAVGTVSSMLGISGGTMMVPLMVWRGIPTVEACGTSAASGVAIAGFASLTIMLQSWHQAGLPSGSLGLIYLPAVIGIACTSSIFANLGARLSKRLPERLLQQLFGVFLMLLAVYMCCSSMFAA